MNASIRGSAAARFLLAKALPAVLTALSIIAVGAGPSFAESENAILVGHVTFYGSVSPPQQLKVNRDYNICGLTVLVQPLVVHESSGGLRGAVVSIEGMKKPLLRSTDEMVTVTNRECAFQPRIQAVKVGQMLDLRNEDPMLHNTHIRMGKGTLINVAQVVGGKAIRKRIKAPGFMSVNCDKHKFMQGYVVAFDHPYFAVTNETGHFRIEGVPSGRWKATIWHEILGTVQTEVTVPEHGEVSVSVEYPVK